MEEHGSEDTTRELDFLFDCAARIILKHGEPEPFLTWMRDHAANIAPNVFAQINDRRDWKGFAHLLGRAIWNATPLPDNQYRSKPLPAPERNAPCPCGSGQKFKRCCGAIPALKLPIDSNLMLGHVLRQLPAAAFKALPYKWLSVEALGAIGQDWIEAGEAARAIKLLEPVFADPDALDGRADQAFDALADGYMALHKPRKKQELIRRVIASRSPQLRAGALQRQVTILADEGRYGEAWRLFAEAQRADPDHPSHAHLEVILLLNSGQRERAVERARFWAARLRRMKNPDLSEVIGFLDAVIADPLATLFEVSATRTPAAGALAGLVRAAAQRPIAVDYGIDEHDADIATVVTPDRLKRVEQDWRSVCPVDSPLLVAFETGESGAWNSPVAESWIEYLRDHPEAFDSIEILDGVVQCIHQLPDSESAWVDGILLRPLLERALAVLDAALAKLARPARTLPWVCLDNRPVLRLLGNLAVVYERGGDTDAARALMERMVFRLNPNDNQGWRYELARLYAQTGAFEQIASLGERYPGDMAADLGFSLPLALYKLGRTDDADRALRAAVQRWPAVYRFLTANNPRQPPLGPYGVTYGGDDEAWLYRERFGALWRTPEMLPILRRRGRRPSAQGASPD
jgi:tetratricopeptide (TPR) repeat protein